MSSFAWNGISKIRQIHLDYSWEKWPLTRAANLLQAAPFSVEDWISFVWTRCVWTSNTPQTSLLTFWSGLWRQSHDEENSDVFILDCFLNNTNCPALLFPRSVFQRKWAGLSIGQEVEGIALWTSESVDAKNGPTFNGWLLTGLDRLPNHTSSKLLCHCWELLRG